MLGLCPQPSMLELCSEPRPSMLELCSEPRPSMLEQYSEPRSQMLGLCPQPLMLELYSEPRSSMLELCNCGNPAPMDFTQFFQGFNAFVARQASTVAPATEIPGARALVEQIKAIQVPFVVCTGSPRSLADLFLRQTGLDQLVSAQQMFCWGDSHLSKADPEFWVPILKELPRGQIVALDDHPHSIEYVMGAGQIGAVMALPSVPTEKFAPLQARFPGRIKLVEGSWDNWP